MQVDLLELNAADERKIRDCIQSDGFGLVLASLQAEYDYHLHLAKLNAVEFLFDSSLRIDVGIEIRRAARVQVALEVLKESIVDAPKHYSIHIEP